jgi:hypothetical protein
VLRISELLKRCGPWLYSRVGYKPNISCYSHSQAKPDLKLAYDPALELWSLSVDVARAGVRQITQQDVRETGECCCCASP